AAARQTEHSAPGLALVPFYCSDGDDHRPVEAGAGEELLGQTRLPRARVTIDQRQGGTPVAPARGPDVDQLPELAGTPHERGPPRVSLRAPGRVALGQAPRPLEPHLRRERPGLGRRRRTQLALEPGREGVEPFQRPRPITG